MDSPKRKANDTTTDSWKLRIDFRRERVRPGRDERHRLETGVWYAKPAEGRLGERRARQGVCRTRCMASGWQVIG